MFKSILVLESPWDDSSVKSYSVWPFINEFSNVMGVSAFYRSFSDKESFSHWVKIFNNEDSIKYPKLLYVAAHGGNNRIEGLKNGINKKTIINELKLAENIKFVHFGSCLFGSSRNLEDLLLAVPSLQWAAGYKESVNWIDSTMFDILFWGRITRQRSELNKSLKTPSLIRELVDQSKGLSDELGFNFSYRRGKKIFTG